MKNTCSFLRCIAVALLLVWSATNHTTAATVRINELMASNESILADENGDFSDWIELYNASDTPVNLFGWSITDNPDNPLKWVFPEVWLQPDSFLIVFASEKDRNVGELHTNFKLSSSGEYLALYDNLQQPVNLMKPGFPALLANQSYGALGAIYALLTIPSPGKPNSTFGGVLASPFFSCKPGLYSQPFALSLDVTEDGASVYYTLDASTPTPIKGTRYTGPITIGTTTIVRAIAVKDGWQTSRVATQSFVFPEKVLTQPANPAGYPSLWGPYNDASLSGGRLPADYEMDPDLVGLAGEADRIVEGLHDLPTVSLVTDKGNLFSDAVNADTGGIYLYTGPYGGLGSGWERPVSLECINTDGTISQIDAGFRLQGQASRINEKNPKHSFIMVFKEQYGPKKWDFPLYGSDFNTEQNKIIFRAGFGNSWTHWSHSDRLMSSYHSDIWAKDVQRAMGHPSSNSRFVNLYLNGLYWGIYALSERLDKDFAQAYLNGDDDDFDVVKDNASGIVDGSNTGWKQVVALANAGLTTEEAYQRLRGNNPDGSRNPAYTPSVDVENLADYILINFYGGNTDWDDHNWAVVYNKVQPDNGFRFLCWDAENILENVNDNVVKENNDQCPSRVFQQLMTNTSFKRLFADRVQLHCFNGGVLTPAKATQFWNTRGSQIAKAIHAEAARWGDNRRDVFDYNPDATYLYSVADYWNPRQTFLRDTYFPQRTDKLIQQLRTAGFFPAADAPTVAINNAAPTGGPVLPGDQLSLTASSGSIFYTLDGTDPVNWSGPQAVAKNWTLCPVSADKRVLVPVSDPGSTWMQAGFNDAAWTLCSGTPGGVGFSTVASVSSLVTLNVGDKMGETAAQPNNSCLIRIPFNVTSEMLAQLSVLTLNLSYDDGFVAYLNGVKVASANAPQTLAWNSASSAGSDLIVTTSIDLSSNIGLLKTGTNILAFHGMNARTSSKDFLIYPELLGQNTPGSSANLTRSALLYGGSVALQTSSHLKARTFSGGSWSALTDLPLLMTANYADLKITEIHYHPEDMLTAMNDTAPEFIELKNCGNSTIDLSAVAFTEGIQFKFRSNQSLRPDSFVVLSNNPVAFQERYGFAPYGRYDGNLSNSGENITLKGLNDQVILSLAYADDGGWPSAADGDGYSLVPVHTNPMEDPSLVSYWRSSSLLGGSPNRDDPASTHLEETLALTTDALEQNAPNPFRNETVLRFSLAGTSKVNLSICDLSGRQVATLLDETREQGCHAVVWQPDAILRAGFYLCRLEVEDAKGKRMHTIKLIKQ